MDLIDLYLACQIGVSKRVDTGELSEEQANIQLAEVMTRITSEAQRREAITLQTRGQQQQAQAAQEQARAVDRLNAWSRETQTRRPVPCTQTMTAMGSVITCN